MIYVVIVILLLLSDIVLIWFFVPSVAARILDELMRLKAGLTAKRIDVEGISWPYLDGGPKGAPVLVLVHGFGDRKDAWTLLAAQLKGKYRIVCPDLPGFGENTKDMVLSYGTADQVERLHGFIAALGLRDVHLAGNSMGGKIAMHYALEHADRLASLTLYDCAGVTETRKNKLVEALERGENPLLLEKVADVDRMLAFSLYHPIKLPGPVKKAMFKASRDNAALFAQIFETFKDEPLMDDRLADIATPTLIIWGREDRIIDVSCVDILAANIPNNRVLILDETGHVPMVERPAECAAAQIGFIEALGK